MKADVGVFIFTLLPRWRADRIKHPDGTTLNGIILADKGPFYIIREFASFEPDGILIVPRKWLRGIRNSEHEICANAIIRNSKSINGAIDISVWLEKSTTVEEVLSGLSLNDLWPAIEVVHGKESRMYLGRIVAISGKSFIMLCFDSDGVWIGEQKFKIADIFKIEFDSRYTINFSKYMRTKAAV